MPISIIGSFGSALYYFTKSITAYSLRKKMIEKGYVNEETQAIFREQKTSNRYAALKWGLLALCGGLALIIMDALQVQADSPLPYGIFSVALSVGFIIYFFVSKKED